MKRLYWIALAAALLAALSGCGMEPIDSPSESSTPESSALESSMPEFSGGESSGESSAPESAGEESSLPEEAAPGFSGDYDNIVPANIRRDTVPIIARGMKDEPLFYAVERNGLWGLADETGRELLPPILNDPMYICDQDGWVCVLPGDTENYEEANALLDNLEELTGRPDCSGHGGSSYQFFAEKLYQVPQIAFMGEARFFPQPFEESYALGDAFFPVEYAALLDIDGDPWELDPNGFWNFSDKEGNLLRPDMAEYDQVGWFYGEALAPVQKDGKWAYMDANGNFATAFAYDSAWGSDYFWMSDTETWQEVSPCFAYGMWDGAAVVCREGKWGVLDETGAEKIPCEYDGGAPYPGGAILKKDGQWGLYLLED